MKHFFILALLMLSAAANAQTFKGEVYRVYYPNTNKPYSNQTSSISVKIDIDRNRINITGPINAEHIIFGIDKDAENNATHFYCNNNFAVTIFYDTDNVGLYQFKIREDGISDYDVDQEYESIIFPY